MVKIVKGSWQGLRQQDWTSSHNLLFAPLKWIFIASNQRTNIYCLQAKYTTSVIPPLKEIDIIINAYIYLLLEPLAPVTSKRSMTSLAFTMSLVAIGVASFWWNPCHFTKWFFFCLWFIYLKMPSTLLSKWSSRRSGGGLITCLQSRLKVSSLYGFSIETWNVGCTLIWGDNSNLYMFLNTHSMMGNKPANMDMNFKVRPITLRKGNLYKMNYTKVHEANAAFSNWCNFQWEMVRLSFGTTALAIWIWRMFIRYKTW